MFWKRKPKCPVTPEDREWIDHKLDWIDQHIVQLQQQPTILPTKEFFDLEFTGTEEDADFILLQLGKYFKVDTSRIILDFYIQKAQGSEKGMMIKNEDGGAAGLYIQQKGKFQIMIEMQQLNNPASLIATIAHELSHYVLIGQKGIYLPGEENEWLTDLLAIAYGFGVFLGNTKFTFQQWQSGDGWGGWSSSATGYLPQQVIAYALASIEFRKGNESPMWINFLKDSFKSDFRKSMLFLIENQS